MIDRDAQWILVSIGLTRQETRGLEKKAQSKEECVSGSEI